MGIGSSTRAWCPDTGRTAVLREVAVIRDNDGVDLRGSRLASIICVQYAFDDYGSASSLSVRGSTVRETAAVCQSPRCTVDFSGAGYSREV